MDVSMEWNSAELSVTSGLSNSGYPSLAPGVKVFEGMLDFNIGLVRTALILFKCG